VSESMQRLLELMARLRDPETGCPWDRKQSFATIAPYTIEEAYEVADAIQRDDLEDLREELGDLLFQVVFHARMAEEAGQFDFEAVVAGIVEKMVRRHPHVFADQTPANEAELRHAWEQQKLQERRAKAGDAGHRVLDGVAQALPALMRAEKLQKRTAKIGFDWPEIEAVADKLREELGEVEAVIAADQAQQREEEIGDLLFSCVNLARHAGVDAESALRSANHKFERRFAHMERLLRQQGGDIHATGIDTLDPLWERVKAEERNRRNTEENQE